MTRYKFHMNAHKVLNETHQQSVKQKIRLLESKTSAEVVCAVATESGRYDRAEGIVGVIVAIFSLGLAAFGCHFFAHPGDWQVDGANLLIQIVAVVFGFVVGNCLAAWIPPIRRIFVSQDQPPTSKPCSVAASTYFPPFGSSRTLD